MHLFCHNTKILKNIAREKNCHKCLILSDNFYIFAVDKQQYAKPHKYGEHSMAA